MPASALPTTMRHRFDGGGRVPSGSGFTVIEMLVVMMVVALLLSVIAPQYVRHIDRARETVLRQNLASVREAIDKFKADTGRLPQDLKELVSHRYLATLPIDPMTERADSWVLTPATEGLSGVSDLHSGAPGAATDGSSYASW